MNRKFIINLIFAVSINLLIKPFWVLGVERGVQNAIGAEQYGLYFSLFSFSFIFNVILDFGINNYNNTFISKHPQLLNKKFTRLVILKGLLVAVYILITMGVALLAGYDSFQLKLLTILCFNQILSFAITYLRSNISGLQFFITDSLLSVLDRMLMIIFCSLLLWGHIFGEMQLQWFVYAQTISYCITFLVCLFVLKPHLNTLTWKWNKAFTLHLLKKSYPFAILGVLMGFYTKIDGVLIERIMPNGNTEAGHYASAYRLLDAANMIAVLFAGLLLPVFSRMIQQRLSPDSLLKLAFTLIITPAIMGASICFFYSHEIVFMLNKSNNPEIEKVLYLLLFSFIFTCTVYIYGTFLTAQGELTLLHKIAFVACIINFTLNLILIKNYGIIGAAISALVTQAFVAVLHYLFTHKINQLKFNSAILISILIFTSIQFLVPYLLQFLNCHFLVKVFLQVLVGTVVLIPLKVFNLTQFKNLILRT